jgi:hypothetical protein
MSPRLGLGLLAGCLLLCTQHAGLHLHRHAHDSDAHTHVVTTLDVDHEAAHEGGDNDDAPSKHTGRVLPQIAALPAETPRLPIVDERDRLFLRDSYAEPRGTGPPGLRPPTQGPPAPFALT